MKETAAQAASAQVPDLLSMASKALTEIQSVFDRSHTVQADSSTKVAEEIMASRGKRIVLHGVGREGLMMRGFTMRLFHLGLHASCLGDMTCPRLGPGDLFIASAGPGSFSSVNALMVTAKEAGARVLLVTAQPDGSAAEIADAVAWLPAQTMKAHLDSDTGEGQDNLSNTSGNILPMGSVYEGSMFILFEVVTHLLRVKLAETVEGMSARHTNME